MRSRWLWVFLAGVLAGPACSISAQDHPVPLEAAELPVEPIPEEPAEGLEGGGAVFLVADGRLQRVSRRVGGSVAAALDSLLEGPRETEVARGLRSAIPAGTALLGLRIDGDLIRVDLSEEFTAIVGEEALLALAQLVYTVTGATSADRVVIWIEGESVPVARGDGEITSRPIGRHDYDELAPP